MIQKVRHRAGCAAGYRKGKRGLSSSCTSALTGSQMLAPFQPSGGPGKFPQHPPLWAADVSQGAPRKPSTVLRHKHAFDPVGEQPLPQPLQEPPSSPSPLPHSPPPIRDLAWGPPGTGSSLQQASVLLGSTQSRIKEKSLLPGLFFTLILASEASLYICILRCSSLGSRGLSRDSPDVYCPPVAERCYCTVIPLSVALLHRLS